jgi:Repeat of unknown function (DUF5648)
MACGAHAAIVEATEFYNTPLKHFFVTTNSSEAAGIDAGSAGAGWSRTGGTFTVYTLASDGSGNTAPVCRFYASGPNSHFFTANRIECEGLRAVEERQRKTEGAAFRGWSFEGIAFYAIMASNGSFCPAGRTPVFRFYNQRGEQNDSNHRYTTDAVAGAELILQGWKAEGVAFCSVTPAIALPTPTTSNPDCGLQFPLTRSLTHEVLTSTSGTSGVLETVTKRVVTSNVGPARFLDQDVIAFQSYDEGKPQNPTYAMIAVNETEVSTLGFRLDEPDFTTLQIYAPAPKVPRKLTIGQSVTNTFNITTRYGIVSTSTPLVSFETVSLVRRESVTTPAGVFPDACVVRTISNYPEVNLESVLDRWIVPGLGPVKSSEISTRSFPNRLPTVTTVDSNLVSVQ